MRKRVQREFNIQMLYRNAPQIYWPFLGNLTNTNIFFKSRLFLSVHAIDLLNLFLMSQLLYTLSEMACSKVNSVRD